MSDLSLPDIPAKRYFTIGEVSDLCGVKTHVLRYWEQEFTQLKPVKRRGNRRYYQHHEVLLIRRIRELLYDEGFTISGARNRLAEALPARRRSGLRAETSWAGSPQPAAPGLAAAAASNATGATSFAALGSVDGLPRHAIEDLRAELNDIRSLLEI